MMYTPRQTKIAIGKCLADILRTSAAQNIYVEVRIPSTHIFEENVVIKNTLSRTARIEYRRLFYTFLTEVFSNLGLPNIPLTWAVSVKCIKIYDVNNKIIFQANVADKYDSTAYINDKLFSPIELNSFLDISAGRLNKLIALVQ